MEINWENGLERLVVSVIGILVACVLGFFGLFIISLIVAFHMWVFVGYANGQPIVFIISGSFASRLTIFAYVYITGMLAWITLKDDWPVFAGEEE